MHLYSDGSPVTGVELQGMILDIMFKSDKLDQHVLPGVALAHGAFGLFSKAFALLWSLFLVIGPWEFGLSFVLSCIRSITTDMGRELKLLDVPDILPAFLKFITGVSLAEVVLAVDMSSRLFKRALRVSGWGHLFGNLMSQSRRAALTAHKYFYNKQSNNI